MLILHQGIMDYNLTLFKETVLEIILANDSRNSNQDSNLSNNVEEQLSDAMNRSSIASFNNG